MADTRNWKWDPATPNLLPGQEEVAWAMVLDVDAAHVGDAAAPRAAGAGDAGRRAAAPPRADAAPDASGAAAAAAAAAGVVSGGVWVVVPPVGEQRPLCGCT